MAEIPVGVGPISLAISPDGASAYVTNKGSGIVSVVDIATQAVEAEIPVGFHPGGIVLSPNGAYLAVAVTGEDTIRIFDASSLSSRAVFPVADRPYGLAYAPDGHHLLVTHLLTGTVTLLTYPLYTTYFPLIDHFGQRSLQGWDSRPSIRVVTPTQTSITIATWPMVAPAPSVVVNATGTRAYLPQTMGNGLGRNTQFDTTVFPKVSVLNLTTNSHLTTEHISLPETDRPIGLPWDVALAKNDQELWVVNSASNDLSVVNISNPTHPTRIANIPVSHNPRGIVLSPDGGTAYINNTLAGTVSVIDANAYTVTQVITTTTLPMPPALLNGKRLFFTSTRSDLAQARWISCNTCHVEGETDGRTWLVRYLGEVPPGEQPIIRRNTTGLMGMIETYPLRWSAEWNESADSEFSVRFEQFGTGLISGAMNPTLGDPNQGRSYDLDCLALFIDSLQTPERSHTLSAAEQRGKAIFESVETQCATCHPAPFYTDLQVHDVGTAGGPGEWFGPLIDTPTLRFLYDSAAYLHDGSAATIYDVLVTKNPNDEHGVTSQLTTSEIQDLIAYLLALPYDE